MKILSSFPPPRAHATRHDHSRFLHVLRVGPSLAHSLPAVCTTPETLYMTALSSARLSLARTYSDNLCDLLSLSTPRGRAREINSS